MAISETQGVQRPLYTPHDAAQCACPIHETGDPPVVPLGIEFAERVSVGPIDQDVAEAIYVAHHSYMPDVPDINIEHHGLYFDGNLVGALTYRQPLLGKLKLWRLPGGGFTRNEELGVDPFLVCGGDVVEVNRICIGVPMKNLASAGLARSMDLFIDDHTDRLDIDWLMTFIRIDHTGSMLRALIDKGWELTGISQPKQAGNRPEKGIRDWPKQRWVCHLGSESAIQQRVDAYN